jgi:hypothetical protein
MVRVLNEDGYFLSKEIAAAVIVDNLCFLGEQSRIPEYLENIENMPAEYVLRMIDPEINTDLSYHKVMLTRLKKTLRMVVADAKSMSVDELEEYCLNLTEASKEDKTVQTTLLGFQLVADLSKLKTSDIDTYAYTPVVVQPKLARITHLETDNLLPNVPHFNELFGMNEDTSSAREDWAWDNIRLASSRAGFNVSYAHMIPEGQKSNSGSLVTDAYLKMMAPYWSFARIIDRVDADLYEKQAAERPKRLPEISTFG